VRPYECDSCEKSSAKRSALFARKCPTQAASNPAKKIKVMSDRLAYPTLKKEREVRQGGTILTESTILTE
jgi:hypothetical protein